jgi:hypothetical protein
VIYYMIRRGELQHRMQRKMLYRLKWTEPIEELIYNYSIELKKMYKNVLLFFRIL